jgi:glycosyltransferase involved in cell wall biosynthesis
MLLPPQPRLFRALALVTDAYGGHGGIAQFNRNLIAALAKMANCAEVVVLPRVIPHPVTGVPHRVAFVRAAAAGKLRYALALLRALRAGRFDLVVIGHINLTAIGTRAARIARAPSVLFVHGIDAWTRHRSASVRRGLRRVRRLVGVSRLTLTRMASWATTGAVQQEVLPNCVDLAAFAPGPRPEDLQVSLGLRGRSVVMTLGRLASEERYKGFDEVMEVLPELSVAIPDVAYLICGDGPDRPRLVRKAEDLGVADRVRFAGFVPEERKADYYRLADAYVMPSRGEGFGIVLLEAMACGVPVVASTLDGGREAVRDGELGILVDPGDRAALKRAILEALARPRGVVPAGLEQFSFASFEARTHALIGRVLAESPQTMGAA